MKPSIAFALRLKPAEALKYFKAKGLKITKSWQELWQEAHAKAFTVAHCAKLDILKDLHKGLTEVLSEGLSTREFIKRLTPLLQSKGWWGKAIDKQTGEVLEAYDDTGRPVQYGSPARLALIYRQNTQVAYMAGRYKAMQEDAWATPYWQYVAVMDQRTRPTHAAMGGRIFRHDDKIWDTLFPPNDWGCRCRVMPRSERKVKDLGLIVESSGGQLVTRNVPVGKDAQGNPRSAEVTGVRTRELGKDGKTLIMLPSAGWSYNPAKAATNHLAQTLTDKFKTLESVMLPKELEALRLIGQQALDELLGKGKQTL